MLLVEKCAGMLLYSLQTQGTAGNQKSVPRFRGLKVQNQLRSNLQVGSSTITLRTAPSSVGEPPLPTNARGGESKVYKGTLERGNQGRRGKGEIGGGRMSIEKTAQGGGA